MQNETSLRHKTMTLCLEQGTVRSLITTKQNKPTFVSFLVFVRCFKTCENRQPLKMAKHLPHLRVGS